MKYFKFVILFSLIISSVFCNTTQGKNQEKEQKRDPIKQPFSSNSIWNMPIGKDAKYIPAELEKAMAA